MFRRRKVAAAKRELKIACLQCGQGENLLRKSICNIVFLLYFIYKKGDEADG
jgi:hypothetical protein